MDITRLRTLRELARCRTMAAVVTVAAMANMPRPRMRRMIRRLAIMRALGHGGA